MRSPLTLPPRISGKIKPSNASAQKIATYNPYGIPTDFREFARLCQIRSGTDFVPFELFDYQEEISNLFDTCKGLAVLKTRQTGWSETISCKMLHRSMLSPAYLGVAFSLGQAESSKLSDRVGIMPATIPDFQWEIDSKTARKSNKGGELLFRPSTPNSARSLASVTDLFLDECGFPLDIAEMYGNATPAQSMVGDKARRILGTTIPPEGLSCWFGSTFWGNTPFDLEEEIARIQEGNGRNGKGFSYWIDDDGWARILLHWWSHPIYSQVPDRLAKIKADEQITESQLQREHNLGLPQSGGSLFALTYLEQLPRCQWLKPIAGHSYLMGVDPNFGSIGNDYFVGGVWDITSLPFQLVAEYRSNTHSAHHSEGECLKLMQSYRPVITSVEGNGGGVAIAEKLARALPSCRVELVRTSQTSKIIHTDRLAQLVEALELAIPEDAQILVEMRRFSALKREAIGGNDDCVMGAAIAFAWLDDALVARNKRDTSWLRAR